MNFEKPQPTITLIYHDFRGMAQPIRYVLLYLDIAFEEILLKQGQNPSQLKIININHTSGALELPCLVDGNMIIQNLFAIVRHLCAIANRQDLLGQTLEQRSLVRQVFYNFLLAKKKQMKLFFGFGEKAAKFPDKKQQIRKIAMQRSHQVSESVIPLAKLKLRNPNQKYIFDHLTLLDFILYEQSFYQVNLFGNLQAKNCTLYQAINSIFKTEFYGVKEKSSLYLKLMKQFKETFQKEEFYLKNKQKLESYSIVCPYMQTFTRQAMKKVWLGPGHYLK